MTRVSTEEFIAKLSAAPAPAPLRLGAVLAALGLAVFAGLALFWSVFGLRAGLGGALMQPMVLAKSALPLALCALALVPLARGLRPEARMPLAPLALPLLGALVLVAARLTQGGGLLSETLGQTAGACFAAIVGLSLIPLALGLWLLRAGASTQPRRSGALLGLALGGAVTSGYALHCVEDSPLFFGLWYSVAILAVGALGAVLGGRMLKW